MDENEISIFLYSRPFVSQLSVQTSRLRFLISIIITIIIIFYTILTQCTRFIDIIL